MEDNVLSGVWNGLANGSCAEPDGRCNDFVLFCRAAERVAKFPPGCCGVARFLLALGAEDP